MRRVVLVSVLAVAALPVHGQFRQLYLSGRVTLPDGTPPPEPAVVRLYCDGGWQPQAYTKKDGTFNFPVGGSQSAQVRDASRGLPDRPVGASGPDRSHVSLTNCEVRAFLPGYTSTKVDLGRRSVFENPELGTIILRPANQGEGHVVSLNTLEAPKKARNSWLKAKKELSKQHPKLTKAAQELEKAVAQYSKFAEAWNLLGEVRIRSGDLDGARLALGKAIEAEAKFVPPYVTLALMELQQRRMDAAADFADKAVALKPDLAEANYYRAVAHSELGNLDAAEESLRALQGGPEAGRFPRTHFLLGNILLQRGDIPAAAVEFQQFLKLEPNSKAAAAVRQQLDRWESEGVLK